MPIEALVLDIPAINILSGAAIEDAWFQEFSVPDGRTDVRRTVIGSVAYILSQDATESSALFVCNVRPDGLGESNKSIVFHRALRMALAKFGNAVGIPRTYQYHAEGNRFSVYAHPYNVSPARIHFQHDQSRIFLYAITERTEDFARVPFAGDLYDASTSSYEDALLSLLEVRDQVTRDSYGIVFDDLVGGMYGRHGITIDEWCTRWLTDQQLKFVNAPLDRPIRLRGSPGTGKTQCMAIKCMKELFDAEDAGRRLRVAFVTHSSGVAHEVVAGMMWALDPEDRRRDMESHLWLGSLYELAKERLGYESKQIVPLSLDGVEGREFQQDLLKDCIRDCRSEAPFIELLAACSKDIRDCFTAESIDVRFLREFANEIACSLDSEGVRVSNRDKVKAYLEGPRNIWQMKLDSTADRSAVLYVHAKYVELLAETDTINLDQMVADLYSYLNSHEWSMSKRMQGFDLIFIDELHYFNRFERLVFHLLVREAAMRDGRVPLFMAYDLKQSTDDRALSSVGAAGRFFRTLQVGDSDLVELTRIFRSTPEIAQLLELIDGAFPALDLEGEWQAYAGESQNESGTVPELRRFDSMTDMLDRIVGEAHRYARQNGGKNVAVLCMSESAFSVYARAGRIRDMISVVESNTDLSPIRYARQRCVFSMPENVAGLQFERVYVINVDQQELDDPELSFGARRQMLSRLYLGISRASKHVTLAASGDCGGASKVLDRPLELDALVFAGD